MAWVCDSNVKELIKEAKCKVDILFVCPHAGIEDIYVPLPEWREKYREFVDCGADAVIASHPHTPQGWEVYKDKYIYYSLGNFCFDLGVKSSELYFDIGLYVEIEIENKRIRCDQCAVKYNNSTVEIDNSKKTKSHINYVNSLLIDEKEYNDYLDRMCERLFPLYKYGLLRGKRTYIRIRND